MTDRGQKIICRATAIKHQSPASAEMLIESGGERKSVSITVTQDFPVSAGDRIFCLVGKVAVSIAKKPNIRLFTLSSQKIAQAPAETPASVSNKMIIEERIFNVMKILSKE